MHNEFDLDLGNGVDGEDLVKELLQGAGKIEVKRDFGVSQSGNVAVEYYCRGKPSGLSVTTADWWAFVLDGEHYDSEVVVLIKTDRLKRICRKLWSVPGKRKPKCTTSKSE